MIPPKFRVWLVALIALAAGYFLSQARTYVVRPPLILGQDAAYDQASAQARVTLEDAGGQVIYIRPPAVAGKTLFVLYPGGLVRPQAYEWLGRALAVSGVETVIPAFPADLAVTKANRASNLIEKYGRGKTVVIGGHSLGGAMAAQYASKNKEQIGGMILMAAYPAKNVNLAEATYPVLSLMAEKDGVASPDDVKDGLNRLPKSAELKVVPGAVHAFFGRYGPQKGDGLPSVTRAQAEAEILKDIREFIQALPQP